jgi:hypothetical protein
VKVKGEGQPAANRSHDLLLNSQQLTLANSWAQIILKKPRLSRASASGAPDKYCPIKTQPDFTNTSCRGGCMVFLDFKARNSVNQPSGYWF